MGRVIKTLVIVMYLLEAWSASAADGNGLRYVETAEGTRSPDIRELVQWTHSRLVFDKDLERLAVGENSVMEVEILNGREALVLAKEIGRTSLFVWYPDKTTETFLFSIVEDLSVLRRALRDIHPEISIDRAPDGAALVLRGTVPTAKYRVAAEIAARDYFGARASDVNDGILVQGDGLNLVDLANTARATNVTAPGDHQAGRSRIINLIQMRELPLSPEAKINQAIRGIGGLDVKIERMRHGDVENDEVDTLLLSGTVRNQITLVRVLNIASRLFPGGNATIDPVNDVVAIANESGGLVAKRGSGLAQAGGPDVFGVAGGNRSSSLSNAIETNVGRAKLLSAAGGRVLSLIEVIDLPQVRVSVQLHEVNRSRMKNWRPDVTAVTGGFAANSMVAGGAGLVVQPDPAARVGAGQSRQIENALQVLGGTLSNQLQIGGSGIAFDLLFALLENEGISRTLSKPTLTVLAGEDAVFQVGGEVPVPTSFAAVGGSSGDTSGGVFSGTEFKPFGVQLMVRAMVGEDDRITLDVRPTISTPDAALTQIIADSTGSSLNSTAFTTRSLDTTTRLNDGQALVIGGLVSRSIVDTQAYTPGLHRAPIMGNLARASQKTDGDRELVIVVTPTIVRQPIESLPLWEFPSAVDLMNKGVALGEGSTEKYLPRRTEQ